MKNSIVWLRQDLRLRDQPALYYAAQESDQLAIVYILNERLGKAQRWWLEKSLQSLNASLGGYLIIRKGEPDRVLAELAAETKATSLYFNRRYEPNHVNPKLPPLETHTFNGSLLIEPWELAPKNRAYYQVFTPFWRRAREILEIPDELPLPKFPKLFRAQSDALPPSSCAFSDWEPGEEGALKRLKAFSKQAHHYAATRDFPATDGTSRLSAHLHFGEISPFQVWREIRDEKFRSELGWREFSYHLLYHFPQLPSESFDARFNQLPWEKNQKLLKAWQQGKTGYPLVDAGMRELLKRGWMHNRVRMIVASFLTKDLRMDWREGAAWFEEHLVDADLANNSASWQWVAGSGADAAPYFRIFNPITQAKKFDPDGAYIAHWCPEYAENPHGLYNPIVDHEKARKEALQLFATYVKEAV